ncbi:MAG TPA: hypothetical protein VFQ68_05825 [Streptosporangiaceae bacterium]|nr:hypothetical protein [Streptosporangiaceae bacterium]
MVLLLVRALAPAGALAVFDEYRDRLAVETGLEPTPRAREICQHVLAGHPGAGQPDPSRAARPGKRTHPLPAAETRSSAASRSLLRSRMRRPGAAPGL